MVAIDRPITETQRWAYPLLLVLSGVALGVSGVPAPLYGIYESTWHLSPLATTIVFAVYAVAALGAVLVSGRISDVVGRKPVLVGALIALLVGLGVFLVADTMALLLLARAIHGAAVGSIVVAGAAALLDLRPDHGVRSGQLSGVSFNVGMTVSILGSALLAQYAPHPLRTPYAVVAVVCLIVGVGVLALREPHTARSAGPIRIAKPAVPQEIRGDFWFSAMGAMASWSVLGVLLSLYPSLAARQTHIDNLVFGGAVVGSQWKVFTLWWNGVDFGVKDPKFGKDIGFFVFSLPWWQLVTAMLTMAVLFALVASAVVASAVVVSVVVGIAVVYILTATATFAE